MIKERQLNDDWQYNNEEEAEMGQLHAIHNNMNAVANVRRALEEQASKPSLTHCCLLYTSPSPRDRTRSRMPSSA